MPARRKLDPEKIRASVNATCPQCDASIPPDQQMRVDFEHVQCQKCGEHFRSARDKPVSTS
jgi:hypothetical protein